MAWETSMLFLIQRSSSEAEERIMQIMFLPRLSIFLFAAWLLSAETLQLGHRGKDRQYEVSRGTLRASSDPQHFVTHSTNAYQEPTVSWALLLVCAHRGISGDSSGSRATGNAPPPFPRRHISMWLPV